MNDRGKIIILAVILLASITFSLGTIIGYGIARNKYSKNTETIVDSVSKANNELKRQVKQLDSLKNEKVIEVKGLSNDSTLKLFKQLVSADGE